MAITLDSTLQSAQDGASHRPTVSLLSEPMQAQVPLYGNHFNTDSTPEGNQELLLTSEGRLINVYIDDDWSNDNLYFYYTDTDRIQWAPAVYLEINNINHASICELSNGNIGVVVVQRDYDVGYLIVSPTGTIITSYTEIFSGGAWTGGISVINLLGDSSAGGYMIVYAEGTAEPPGDTDTYSLQRRTSSNFTSWSSASEIATTGLSDTKYKDNPNLFQHSNGRLFLHFDYMDDIQNNVELRNIYGQYSDDNGITWSNTVKVTDYDSFGDQGIIPSVAEKEDGTLYIIHQETNRVKHYDTNLDGYPDTEDFDGGQIQYDSVEKKLICNNIDKYGDGFENVVLIDTETDTYIKFYDGNTSPSLPAGGAGELQAMRRDWPSWPFSILINGNQIHVINWETEEIRLYVPESRDFQPPVSNFYMGPWAYWYYYQHIYAVYRQVGDERRLYLAGTSSGELGWGGHLVIGYLNLDQTADPVTGQYTFTQLAHITNAEEPLLDGNWIAQFEWVPEVSRWVVVLACELFILNEDCEVIYRCNQDNIPGWPVGAHFLAPKSIREAVYMATAGTAGSVYFSFDYNSDYPDRRGICRWDIASNNCTYYQPNWFTCTGECGMRNLFNMGDGRIMMSVRAPDDGGSCDRAGIAILDTNGHGWTFYSENNVPGMFNPYPFYDYPQCDDWEWDEGAGYLAYDAATQTIFASYRGNSKWLGDSSAGVIVFSELGAYSTIRYTSIADVESTPAYGEFSDFTINNFEYNGSMVVDEDGVAWTTWDHMDSISENSLIWDTTVSDKYVEDFLVDGSQVEITWEIDKPTSLKFELSHGQYFDSTNLLSTWSVYFKMGRIITIELGEIISDTEYLQAQGVFFIKESTISLSQGYPTIKVTAEDMRSMWDETHIVASEYFSNLTPKTVTENLLTDHGDLTAQDFSIPTYVQTHNLYHQFIDINLSDAIQLIMDHFGYFGFVNVNGQFQPRQINFSGSPIHTYSDSTKIIEYTPDNKYATWVNRIIVTGMSNVYSEVLFEQESITNVSGTVGHWGGRKERIVYYSEDRQRVCRDPRLEIFMSLEDFEVWGFNGGGGEEITYIDPEERYLIITLDIPDFSGPILITIGAILALGYHCSRCDGFTTGYCGPCILSLTIMLNLLLAMLGAIANYSYRIWARPVGHERASFQAQADDYDFQDMIDRIVTETIDDPLCYSIGECYRVAHLELNVVMAQRRRIKFKKSSHLQDEIGDIIRTIHPFSGETVDTFVTKLKRSYKIGGETTDSIEGWRLT